MKNTIEFFPVIKKGLVGATENEPDTIERSCKFELMDSENAPN